MSQRPTIWQMVREAIENRSPTTYSEIREYIRGKYGDVNEHTVTCQIIICSVNHPSRVHYPENKKPRVSDSQYDFLFNVGRGRVERYDPETHGRWEMRPNEYGKMEVRQCDLIDDGDDDAEEESNKESGGLPFALECHLRDFLERNIETIPINGMSLKLYVDPDGRDGVEYPTDVGPIDILAVDELGNFVVVELKVSKGSDRVVGQAMRYMGWVKKHLAAGKKVAGIIVACEIDEKLKYAASMIPNIALLEYKLRFDLQQVALA